MDWVEWSDREYFAQVGKRPGMYVGSVSYDKVAAFLEGYDQAARRCGRPGLDGWREWLIARRGLKENNLVWSAQVLYLALPDGWAYGALSAEQDQRAVAVLFELLDEFLAEQEVAASDTDGR